MNGSTRGGGLGARAIDLGGLLTIDVSSELRKLAQAQFQGPWQIPAELVRRAIRHGARTIRVSIERRRVVIRDDGTGFGAAALAWAGLLLDVHRANEERHAALTALEAAGELVVLAMAGLEDRRIEISTRDETGLRRLVLERSGALSLTRTAEPGQRATVVAIESPILDRRQVAQWLQSVARFAEVPIVVDDKPLVYGMHDALVHVSLPAPLRGRIAIPSEGDTAHVWLLEHGLVTGHVTVPEAPCFEVALELGSAATDLSAARLREDIAPHLKGLVDAAVRLLVQLGRRAASLSEPARAYVARLLLQAAQKRLHVDAIVQVPVFRVVDGRGRHLVDLLSLRNAAGRDPSGMLVLTALYPGQRAERFALGTSPVLVADATERSRIAELMNVRFRPPDQRDSAGSFGTWARRSFDRARRAVLRTLRWLRHPGAGKRVPEALLTPQERDFVERVRVQLAQDSAGPCQGVRLCMGAGPVRIAGGTPGELVLPRGNPAVIAAVAAVAHDDAWLYPALLALLDGRGLPPTRTRALWLTRNASAARSDVA